VKKDGVAHTGRLHSVERRRAADLPTARSNILNADTRSKHFHGYTVITI